MILIKGITAEAPKPLLSKQQETIRRMVVDEGLSTKQIMRELNITEKTVKWHMTALYKAFNVKSKYEFMYKQLTAKLRAKG